MQWNLRSTQNASCLERFYQTVPKIIPFRPSFLWLLKKTSANSLTRLFSCLAAGEVGKGSGQGDTGCGVGRNTKVKEARGTQD